MSGSSFATEVTSSGHPMSGTLVPSAFSSNELAQPADVAAQSWGPPPAAATGGLQLGRYLAALRRYKWLILLTTIIGTAIGYGVSRFIKPVYEVNGTIWITDTGGGAGGKAQTGPITAPAIMNAQAWQELFTSFAILDPVVSELGLYLEPDNSADSAVFRGFQPLPNLVKGQYSLRVEDAGRRWTLMGTGDQGGAERVVERGAVGDSIGRSVGFLWAPPPAALGRGRTIKFDVATPREASVTLRQKLSIFLPLNSNFMRLSLSGDKPEKLARTMNLLTAHFLNTADVLKKRNLTEFSSTLNEQLDVAQRQLHNAEFNLEQFKYNTITEPSDNLVVQAGTSVSMTPAMQDYFTQRVQLDNVRKDREALATIINDSKRGGGITTERLLSIPGVLQASPDLTNALKELSLEQSKLRTLQLTYTNEHPSVKSSMTKIETLVTKTIPAMAQNVLVQLQSQEQDLDHRLAGASREIRQIPARTIEEQRLTREVVVANAMYTQLKQNYTEAKMAEASAVSDVALLDSAIAPLRPTSNTFWGIMAAALGASIGLGIALALLLDRLDKRFRYPEQATKDLGLDILGGVPTIRRGKQGQMSIEEMSQVVEAFRALRLNTRNACDGAGPVSLTISSPGAGDGKSTISSNLALAFAEAGYRTLLVDGDVRRGRLHADFGCEQRPGLIDCLTGEAAPDEAIRETAHANLFLLPCGTRRQRAPELLASDAAGRFVRSLKNRYDAVIIDTAPLGAGIDPYAIGAATTNMLIVLRSGKTDRKLAAAKLSTLDRLPVRVIGAVLNDIQPDGMYKYYSYLDGYTMGENQEEDVDQLEAGTGTALVERE